MGGARHNILVKFKQQQKMQPQRSGQMLDAVNILHFSEQVADGYYYFKEE